MRTGVINHLRSLAEQLVDGVGVDEVKRVNFFNVSLGRLLRCPESPRPYEKDSYRRHHSHYCYNEWQAQMMFSEGGLNLGDILESFSRILARASVDDPFLIRKQQSEHLSQRPDVRPVVDNASGKELWSGETRGSGRTLENRPRACVRETEVDEFEVVPVMGDEYVRGLEIPVDDLFGMEITQSVTELKSEFSRDCPVRSATGEEFCQSDSIHPFHLDAVAEPLDIPEIIDLPDGSVGETITDLVFFPEEGFISCLSSEGRLESFESPESSIFVYEPEFTPASLGTVDEYRILRFARDDRSLVGKESGVFWHDAKGSKK